MKSSEHYRQQFFRAIDHGLIQEKRPKRINLLGFDQFVSVLRAVRDLLPKSLIAGKNFAGFFRDLSRLPIDPKHYELKNLVASGWRSDVFLLEPREQDKQSLVLKLEYSGAEDLKALEQRASQISGNAQKIRNWYGEIPDFIPDQLTVTMSNFQKLGGDGPVIATIQKFYGENIRDLATEISLQEWKQITERYPELLANLKTFVQITKAQLEKTGELADITGHKNLALVDAKSAPHLLFLDLNDTAEFSKLNQRKKNFVAKRISYLESMTI